MSGAIIGKKMMKIGDIRDKCVAIVRFGPSGFDTDGIRPGEYFQVTIDPARVSPSGDYIRFGQDGEAGQGDEIFGWQRCDAICVVEILAEFYGDEFPVLEYGNGFNGITEIA